jgi:hypothetical protein
MKSHGGQYAGFFLASSHTVKKLTKIEIIRDIVRFMGYIYG